MNNTNNPNSEATVIDGKKLSIEEYLDQDEKKDLLRFLTAGSVDDGKSTLIGRLLFDSKTTRSALATPANTSTMPCSAMV